MIDNNLCIPNLFRIKAVPVESIISQPRPLKMRENGLAEVELKLWRDTKTL